MSTLDVMMSMLPRPGRWIHCEERQPPKYGTYLIIKRSRSRRMDYDEYLWNGSGWVTHGHSLSYAVEAWFEEEKDA